MISLELMTSPTEEVATLVAELTAELEANYDKSQCHGLSLDAIFQPHIQFFLARENGVAVGCGGIAFFDGFAELKRMYVRPEDRGRGIANVILDQLVIVARAEGYSEVRLETGDVQHAAIRFYERAGFTRCPIFSPYDQLDPHRVATSVFMSMPV